MQREPLRFPGGHRNGVRRLRVLYVKTGLTAQTLRGPRGSTGAPPCQAILVGLAELSVIQVTVDYIRIDSKVASHHGIQVMVVFQNEINLQVMEKQHCF